MTTTRTPFASAANDNAAPHARPLAEALAELNAANFILPGMACALLVSWLLGGW